MERTCFLLCVTMLLVHCLVACLAMAVTNITTDQSALLALKANINFDQDHVLVNNWTTGTSVCTWIGVICSTRHKRVAALNIPFMGLIGTIPPHLGNLSFLVRLNITNNSFHGDLPKELANLRRLKFLSVRFNQLTGSIPFNIFNISSLQVIDFRGNGLSGTLPADMCHHLPKLKILYLSYNELHGKIPPNLYKCSELQFLSLWNNKFSGPIPSEIGNFTMLEQIYLGGNNLKGEIPQQLGQLKTLKMLSVPNAGLTGLIPPAIFNISSLNLIDFQTNSLSGDIWPMDMCHHLPMLALILLGKNKFTGSLPSSIGNCTLLTVMSLAQNNITGSIPQDIDKLHRLKWVGIGSNGLSGHIPSNIFNISTLEFLDLSGNHLSGYLPSSIGDWWPNIKELHLGGNKLTGIIPASISNASEFILLDISYNSFTGFIPDTIGNLKLIQWLAFEGNNFTSTSSLPQHSFLASLMKCKQLRILWISYNPLNVILPVTIGNLSHLESFRAINCKIMSNIPREIGNLSNLINLQLQGNELSGEIPTTVGQLWKLQFLDLGGNKLQPSIPNNLCDLWNLAYLSLKGNKLFGSLPTCLGNLYLLRSLELDSNGLTSTIPLTLWNVRDLLVLNLASNSLSGELPPEIGNLKVVNEIDLSRNQLSGYIPSSIEKLQNLLNLSLAHNRFQGPIPQSFSSLVSLESLDLSGNNLSGVIPKSLEQLLYLKYLDLSSNKLEGEIPEGGPFANFTAQSFMWNKALCGLSRFQVRPCTSANHQSRKTMVFVLKYVLPIASLVALILLSVILLKRYRKRKITTPNQENLFLVTAPKRFSYQELLQATSGFTECNLLGTGSFSSVYKGTLFDGMMVAIKVFNLQLEGSLKSFDIECEVMRNVRHRNLIKVIGSCSNLDFKALVVDYMANGTLEKWLYNPDYCLDILQRMNIMIDVASALEYLHFGYSNPVVHCDVKPSNVLLDEDMVAHLGDYGITKLLGKEESTIQTKTLATIGYIAPEYGAEGVVSINGDVYSYGIMLLETFTRKKPTNEMFIGEMSLKRWVNESLACAFVEVIDVNILGGNNKHFSVKEHCIKSIMELAISCCAESPKERVNMKEVVATLKKIRVEFLTNTRGA